MTKYRILLFLGISSVFLGNIEAFFGKDGVKTSPLVYKVPIREIEFYRELDENGEADGTWFPFGVATEDVIMDIASVEAGAVVGDFPQTEALPQGTYSSMRFLIRPAMTAKGIAYDSSRNNTVWLQDGEEVTFTFNSIEFELMTAAFETGNTVSTREATIEAALVSMPINENALAEMQMDTRTIDGVIYMYGDMPLYNDTQNARFEIDETGTMPTIQLNFDTTNRLEFVWDEFIKDYLVTLQGPDVRIVVDGVEVVSKEDPGQPVGDDG